ncbi:DinB family protein [Taibaiella chishuiensis]|uniref:Putative damage-inducible protein DinB n=1 Tax=Taibaiella chishuiensis TaxID=1434707 RepID=A0A2P8CR36_9BACT|nr:DinB family protein [Taibaiella chishuiensis]PSK87416.1 putative damage-inducible protein DinB [Taibaiella chishuiensis]
MIEQQNPIATGATTSLASLMQSYAHYNLWANTTLVNWLRSKDPATIEQEVASSFPSIKLTIVHIWQVQRYWLTILSKEEFVPVDFKGDAEKAFTTLLEHSETLARYISEMTAEDISDKTLVVSPWFECNFENFEYIMQIMNHSTYHRGQIVTIGRNLGFTDAPMTDYNYYKIYGAGVSTN